MIPYFEQFQWPDPPLFGRLAIRGFSSMVVTGILVGYWVLQRRAQKVYGLDKEDVSDFVFFTVVIGFFGSHVFDVVFYFPEKVAADPLILLRFWDGISSYGGFICGLFGAWLFFQLRPQFKPRVWEFLDCLGYAWPFAWWIARVGCFFAHDHPGKHSDFFLAVQFPGGARHDLGLYEALYTLLVIVPAFLLLKRKADRPPGFFIGAFLVIYAPVRFALDFLRVADKTYIGLTPAQYVSAGALLFGIWIIARQPGAKAKPEKGKPRKEKSRK